MTQKDKVKELVGRGLHSYHTKALQQMDRIEKKNKEQNHKISILTNELDNDYLTKTEEGSVVSLEHSKEGMVYIDSLEGNTLVNYCTDGSKELTLNGDIDLEGTFVTTTEGVDNGKVDVMCEGNTLVNLIKYDAGSYCPTYAWEIGETYTMIVEFTSNAECQLYIEENITWAKLSPITNGVKVGYNKFVVKLTIPSNYTGLEKINITNRVNGIYNSNVKFTDIKPIVLKGDWTNKEIPQSHFEGMKSVGQDDENGHKIEILSTNSDGSESNKKEILINEPLRGLPNGVKDRFVKIGSKWFIERNRGIREYQEGDLDLTDVLTDMTNTEYSLETPIYEPLEINPELICYNDTTHISNNSTIPCNMKVKNSGYNAIIKPSALYTITLDTNKSGTIGMNLGGVKGTTTNNVLTLTTPATLTDDSLRIYGKGIKGSKVRLLEGDKTNWIPSFFEGMKSSFEDKFDTTDNTYKMEILSNNKNLLNLDKLLNAENYLKGTYSSIKIPLKPNTTYYFKFDFKSNNIHRWIGIFSEPLGYYGTFKKTFAWNDNIDKIIQGTFITDNSTEYYLSVYQPSVSYSDNNWYKELFTNVYEDFIISQVDDNYMEGKSNKIQFSSIEPLRGVGNVRDRFVFKDNKLMIERNTKEILLNGSEDWRYREVRSDGYCYTLNISDLKKYGINSCKQGYVDRFFMRHLLPFGAFFEYLNGRDICLQLPLALGNSNVNAIKDWLNVNNTRVVYELEQPIYEEVPFELQKIILEGYENGTLFFDTNIPPTVTTTYAGETPIVKSVRLNKTEVLNNTNDINDNIVPYLMDMDYRVVCLELATETQGISMARLFGGVYEMLKRDIQSKRYSIDEYRHRLDTYLSANKITEDEYNKLGDMLND